MSQPHIVKLTDQPPKLLDDYVLWVHDLNNKNWTINSYEKKYEFNNVETFCGFVNNFYRLGYKHMHFFLMKKGVDPIWEHEENRNGGVCSIKIDIDQCGDIFTDLICRMVTNSLSSVSDDINGVSISPKNNWAIIKIWNKSKDNILTETLTPEVLEKYHHLSLRYKANNENNDFCSSSNSN